MGSYVLGPHSHSTGTPPPTTRNGPSMCRRSTRHRWTRPLLAASQPSVPSTSRQRHYGLAQRHELPISRRCISPWRRFGARSSSRPHRVRCSAPPAFTARSIPLRSCGHIRGLLTASRGSMLPHSAANGTGSLPTLAAAYRTMPSGFYLFDPTLSTLLAGPHGPTVVCAVPGRVAAPSPLNIRISYEQTGDCLFSR